MRKSLIALMAVALFAAVPVLAGRLMKNRVSAAATWVVHADFERFNKSQIGQLIRADLANRSPGKIVEQLTEVLSMHPLDAVRDITWYGQGIDKWKIVVLCEGKFDKGKLLALMEKERGHQEIKYRDITLHKFDKEPQVNACFYQDDLIVMAFTLDASKHAIDVLDGSATNATKTLLGETTESMKPAFLQLTVLLPGETADELPKAAIFRQSRGFHLVVGETEDKVYADLALTTKSKDVARNVSRVLDGLMAYMALKGEKQSDSAEIANKVQLSCVQNMVWVRFESDPDSTMQFLKEHGPSLKELWKSQGQ